MSGRSTYKGLYLDNLRERVISAYLRNRRFENKDDRVIHFPNNVRNKIYKKFSDDIFEVTNVIVSNGTIFKLLYQIPKSNNGEDIQRPDQPFDDFIIETFKKYADTIRSSTGLVSEKVINPKGAQLIDSAFRTRMGSKDFIPKKVDFYLAKKDNDCQWRGVVRNWDHPRTAYEKVEELIMSAFNWESRVTAVITGSGGCGKSTFLRRLAINCIKDEFTILWVTNLREFSDNDLEIIYGNTSEKYLVFIEDWSAFNGNPSLGSEFLNKVVNIQNVRLIIGDRYGIEKKEYSKYILGDNYFDLSAIENKNIIDWILVMNRDWEDAAKNVLSSTEIYDAPLFLILFVIARSSEAPENIGTKDILSLFRDIISSDLERINNIYPGLGKALYYWSSIFQEHRVGILWSRFLEIADYYNGDTTISTRLLNFKENTSIHQILFHYISVKEFFNPDLKGSYYFTFHHDLLMQEGLSKQINVPGKWHPFDYSIKLEILNFLLQRRGTSFYQLLKDANPELEIDSILNDEKQLKFVFWDAFGCGSTNGFFAIDSALLKDEELKSYIENAGKITDPQYWSDALNNICFWIHPKHHFLILGRLILNGCEDISIASQCKLCFDNESYLKNHEIGIKQYLKKEFGEDYVDFEMI